jgi:hypothetical protein
MMQNMISCGAVLGLCAGLFVPGPIGFKDQGRGQLIVCFFLLGALIGCGICLIRWEFQSGKKP